MILQLLSAPSRDDMTTLWLQMLMAAQLQLLKSEMALQINQWDMPIAFVELCTSSLFDFGQTDSAVICLCSA